MNLDKLLDEPIMNNNLVDLLGYCALLGANLCCKTFSAEINKWHYNKNAIPKNILVAHPDQNIILDKG